MSPRNTKNFSYFNGISPAPVIPTTVVDVSRGLFALILVLALLLPTLLSAQFYPVQVSVFGEGAFSGSINEIAAGNVGSFQAQVSFNDIASDQRDIYLKVALNGGGIETVSRPVELLASDMVFDIKGGEFMTIKGSEFGKYFDPLYQQNLPLQLANQLLKEGTYRLTVEVYDAQSLQKISNTAFCSFSILHGTAPIVSAPQCGTSLSGSQITFNWRPATSFSLVSIDYELQMVELLPGDANIFNAFKMAEVGGYFYTEKEIAGTSFPFSATGAGLQTGYTYGFRVKARARLLSNNEEVDIFANNGYSSNCWFTYLGNLPVDECPVLETLTGPEACTYNSVTLNWTLVDPATEPENQKYTVAYRPYKPGTTTGFVTKLVEGNTYTFSNLKAEKSYQVYVKPYCAGTAPDSLTAIFRTPALEEDFVCGQEPKPQELELADLLTQLNPGDIIYLNKLPVLIPTALTATNGQFNGEGSITFAFQPFQQAIPGLVVQLKNVVVDTDYKVVAGLMQSEYDANWRGVVDVDALFMGGSLQAELLSGTITVDTEIPGIIGDTSAISVQTKVINGDTTSTVTINFKVGTQPATPVTFTVPPGKTTVVIKDADNSYYAVDVTKTPAAVTSLGRKNPDIGALLASFDDTKYDQPQAAIFTQVPGDYAFDAGGPTPYFSCNTYGPEYNTLSPMDINDTETYYIPWKLTPTGTTAKVHVTLPAGAVLANYQFVTRLGITLNPTATTVPNQYQLELPPGEAGSDELLYALYTAAGVTTQAGQLRLRTESPVTYPVTLVAVGDATIPDSTTVKTALDDIFRPYAIDWDVTVKSEKLADTSWDLDGDGRVDSGDQYLSEYSEEQNALHQAFKAKYGVEAGRSVMFLFNTMPDGATIDETSRNGDMPIGRKWGYLFGTNGSVNTWTLAHELGHGRFSLWHTFSDKHCDLASKGTTNNLMDYPIGTEMNRFQWEAAHLPAPAGGIFQSDEDGAGLANKYIAIHSKTDVSFESTSQKDFITFYAPSGLAFSLPKRVKQINNSGKLKDIFSPEKDEIQILNKFLTSFELDNIVYVALSTDNQFLGYVPEFMYDEVNALNDTYSISNLQNLKVFDLTKKIDDSELIYYAQLEGFSGDYHAKGKLLKKETILTCEKCGMPIEECYCGKACFCFAHNNYPIESCNLNRYLKIVGIPFFYNGHLVEIKKYKRYDYNAGDTKKSYLLHDQMLDYQGRKLFLSKIGSTDLVVKFEDVISGTGTLLDVLENTIEDPVKLRILDAFGEAFDKYNLYTSMARIDEAINDEDFVTAFYEGIKLIPAIGEIADGIESVISFVYSESVMNSLYLSSERELFLLKDCESSYCIKRRAELEKIKEISKAQLYRIQEEKLDNLHQNICTCP